jgi:hypothetical protein
MKDQYFGDINDYLKYGLLRTFRHDAKLSMMLCWMLTPSDGRTDGSRIKYLSQPKIWSSFDSRLFEFLSKTVILNNKRCIAEIENSGLLENTKFFSKLVPTNSEDRRNYFQKLFQQSQDVDIIFFDPDNGIEVPSKPSNRKDSEKFLYWLEIQEAYRRNHSLLIYQHFPRENRETYTNRMSAKIFEKCEAEALYSFRTHSVVYFLVLQKQHVESIESVIHHVASVWQDQLKVVKYMPSA